MRHQSRQAGRLVLTHIAGALTIYGAASGRPDGRCLAASTVLCTRCRAGAKRCKYTLRVVECTFVATIVEDHFVEQQHFMYGLCSLDGNASYAFGSGTLHLVNVHSEDHYPGERLVIRVRNATNQDLHEQHRMRRQLQVNPQPEPNAPMWHESRRGLFVEAIISATPPPTTGANREDHRGRELGGTGRTLLSLCLQYHHSTHTCTGADEPWNMGVPQTHTTASYGRLDPAWDQQNSRFYIIQMDTIERGEQMDFEKVSCDTFMENEPAYALELAKKLYPDAQLSYSHTEFIVPTNLAACKWAGIATLGTYSPNGNPATAIPNGPWKAAWSGTTWCKGPGKSTRAHELGHNMAMMHSSSFSCDGFVEYGDTRCIMGSGSTTFNAPQRLTHGWISQAPQFATNQIYPSASLTTPPTPTSEICVLTPAALGDHLDPKPKEMHDFVRWHVRRLSFDPQTSTVGDCSIVYLAKEGHPSADSGSWQAQLHDGSTAEMGTHSQIVISYDDSGYVSVHTHAAWGIGGNLKRPVLLDSIASQDYAITFTPGKSWACPTYSCWVSLSVCARYNDCAEIVTSVSTIGVVHAESVAIDACNGFRSPALPPYPPNKAPMPPPQPPPSPPARNEAQEASQHSGHGGSADVSLGSSFAASVLLSLQPQGSTALVNCTFIDTICEDHFDTQQHFRYGSCAVDGDTSYAFGPQVLHLVNLHGQAYQNGHRLQLAVRSATAVDLREQHKARRRLQTDPPLEPNNPTWLGTGRGFFVEQVLHHETTPNRRNQRALSHDGQNTRSLLTICMQYPDSASTCTDSQNAFTQGVDTKHTTASYGRLDPPWSSTPSRFYIVNMPPLNNTMRGSGCQHAGCEYWPDGVDMANYVNDTNLTLETIFCDDFLAREAPLALSLARLENPDANLGYNHVEFLIPSNTAQQRCETCPLTGGCDWGGLGSLAITIRMAMGRRTFRWLLSRLGKCIQRVEPHGLRAGL